MTDDESLAMITINPARQLGISELVGSIEEGKQGDLVIFDSHPLSVYTVPQMTFVDGVKYFDIKEDKNDQRLTVSPTEMVEDVYLRQQTERCMQDTEHLFEMAGTLFNQN
jgi:urease alpha subunit